MSQCVSPSAANSPVLFSTVSGSRLYGLSHAGSDNDVFVVTSSSQQRAIHRQSNDDDYSFRGLDTFLHHVTTGAHQSVEAAFSPFLEFTDEGARWRPMIHSLRVTSPEAFLKYERTIKSFSFGDFKRRRHAVRLFLNLADLRAYGKFNPVLTPAQVSMANEMATNLISADLARELLPGVPLDIDEQEVLALEKRYSEAG